MLIRRKVVWITHLWRMGNYARWWTDGSAAFLADLTFVYTQLLNRVRRGLGESKELKNYKYKYSSN